MSGLMSKRQQARNEKALQDLIRTGPGNDRCADCGTKNPGWASWSLGIFLCMSCAALHRKMGTHISKVKSLSMDSWSSDQVDNMKKVGNTLSNKKYNPGNIKPDIPIDADEAGGVMERFIRRKYEFKEFVSGTARRATIHNTGSTSISSAEDQPPPLPPKPAKKFGFALRSTSATFSRPRIDKYSPPMSPPLSGSDGRESPPRMNKASRVFGSKVGNAHDDTFKAKMAALREMGFHDAEQNSYVLGEMNNSLSGAVEALVRLGGGARPASRNITPVSTASGSANGLTVDKKRPSDVPPQAPPKDNAPQAPPKDNVDPFAALDNPAPPPRRAFTQPLPQSSQPQLRQPSTQLSQPQPQPQSQQNSYNPFLSMASHTQPQQALQDAFGAMQLSQTPQPQSYATSQPNSQYNPFVNTNSQPQGQILTQNQQYQQSQQPQQSQPHQQNPYAQPIQPQQTSNPFLRSTKSQTFSQPQSNPFLQQNLPQNPWLATQPLVQSPQPQPSLYQTESQPDFFGSQQVQQPAQQQQQQQQQQQYQQYNQTNGHDQTQPNYMVANGGNPYYAQNTQQQAPQSVNPYQSYQRQQAQQQPMSRYDNASILQLYNYPQMAPNRPLQALQEEVPLQAASAPSSAMASPGRSVTMPVTGSLNPFNSAMSGHQAVQPQSAVESTNVYNHSSRDSMAFVGLGSGRQSPDAFAGLSARYGR